MTIWQAIILGVIQGLTEFLPVSSSGHLIFLPKLFGWTDQRLAFDVIMHLATLLAVIIYFRKRLWQLIQALFFRQEKFVADKKFAWLIVLSIIPAAVVGLVAGDWLEAHTRAAWIVGVNMIGWGVVLGIADWKQRISPQASISRTDVDQSRTEITWKKALFIGSAQALALIPGTSRSGITMTAGLLAKLDRKAAAEFSFLLSVPIIALAGLAKITDLGNGKAGDLDLIILLAGFLASALSGLLAIWGLMKIIQKWSFMPFVVYRVAVGILILVWLI